MIARNNDGDRFVRKLRTECPPAIHFPGPPPIRPCRFCVGLGRRHGKECGFCDGCGVK